MNDSETLVWGFDNSIGLPAANQYAVLYDSTASFQSARYAPSATVPLPGGSNGRMRGMRATGIVTPAGQPVTLQLYIRTGSAGTSADWSLDTTASGTGSTGTIAVPAGTSQTFSWAPNAPDGLILMLAGATPPTSIFGSMQLTHASRIG